MALVDRFLVTGRVAIVSGSGRGIGAACARTLAEAGADVALVARTKADLDAVAAQVSQLATVPSRLSATCGTRRTPHKWWNKRWRHLAVWTFSSTTLEDLRQTGRLSPSAPFSTSTPTTWTRRSTST
jgi:NAD(P)-dependent dehydrogenase (short-subunit alcohol dehydrogenase family)